MADLNCSDRAENAAPARAGADYPAVTRLESLDVLRGLCALAVAVFHFHSWGGVHAPKGLEGFLAICGTYGVSVFFVLSGYSLAHAYADRFNDSLSPSVLAKYARRRFGRLAPLFGTVVIASLLGRLATGGEIPGLFVILANILLVFGFVDPAQTPVVGGWSIGVEVVFYVLFPIFILLRRHALIIIGLSIFLTGWITASVAQGQDLVAQWAFYVLPANQLVFFASGVFAALWLRGRKPFLTGWRAHAVVGAILIAIFLVSVGATEFTAVVGARRAALVLLSVMLVIATAQIRIERFKLLASLAGGASYPLYLIHPLVFLLAIRILPESTLMYIGVLCLAIAMAIAVDLTLDKPLQKRIKSFGW